MKSRIGTVLVGLALTATMALAQPRQKTRMPMYDVSKEATIAGTIDDVQQMQHGRMTGIHFLVKTEKETVDVHLGPSYFIENQGFHFAKGDQVEVLGSRVKMGGSEAFIAREVTKDGKTLTLRDSTGRPKWARGRT